MKLINIFVMLQMAFVSFIFADQKPRQIEVNLTNFNINETNSIDVVVNTKETVSPIFRTIINPHQNFPTQQIFETMQRSYPEMITVVPQEDNKMFPFPAIQVGDKIFYEKAGRILPESELNNWEQYGANLFYLYPKEIKDPKTRTPEEIERIKERGSRTYRQLRRYEHPGLRESLYGLSKASDTNGTIVKDRFLGKQIRINKVMQAQLKAVEKELYAQSKTNKKIAQFLKEVNTVYSFYWRTIEGTSARSLHSYGLAIDTLNSRSKKSTYWLWRQNLKKDWYNEPISVRWNPPNDVIRIFEKYGFAWGGKWDFYDTMHFEYRPEILLLNGFDVIFVNNK